jgi:hypothetical protein
MKARIFILWPGLIFGLAILVIVIFPDVYRNEVKSYNINTGKSIDLSATKLLSNQSLQFITNEGQIPGNSRYHVRGSGHNVLFYDNRIEFHRIETTGEMNKIIIEFEGASKSRRLTGQGKLPAVAHFFKGSEPEKWRTNVPIYSSVLYKDLYPGIDMACIGDKGNLESEFYITSGTDYCQIRLHYKGTDSITVRDDGALVIKTALGEMIEKKPFAFQEVNGNRKEIKAQYALLADGSVGFLLDDYNDNIPVVIDPELVFITSFSSGSDGIVFNGVMLDDNGDVILAGGADNLFPVTDEIESSNHAGGDGYDGLLMKLDGTTGEVIYSALFGGSVTDWFEKIAMDKSGNLYLTGTTSSEDFPVVNAAQESPGGNEDAFLVVFDSSMELTYSTYLGGNNTDWGMDIAVDESGNMYITGRTASDNFPVAGGYQQEYKGGSLFDSDIFVTKYSSTGEVSYSTYLGGTEDDLARGITVNSAGEATIVGYTKSEDYPVANAYQETYGGGSYDIVYSRLNSNGNGLVYSSYFGGSDSEFGTGIAIGPDGNVFISGRTASADFPAIGGTSLPEEGAWDAVIFHINNSGQPVYSLRSNVPGFDAFYAIAVDDSNTAFPVGTWKDTLWIYQKNTGDSLKVAFKIAAPDHSVNDVHLSDDFLAWGGVYWGSPEISAQAKTGNQLKPAILAEPSKGSGGSTGKVRILELFQKYIDEYGTLIIKFRGPNKDGLTIDADEEGHLTINGVATKFKTNDFKLLEIRGSDGDDAINLNAVNDVTFPNLANTEGVKIIVYAQDGDDIVLGSENYHTVIHGGKGNDRLFGGKGFDALIGDEGDDELHGFDSGDNLMGGDGNDIIFGGNGDDVIRGGFGEDELYGQDGNDIIRGDGGIDNIFGGHGNDDVEVEHYDEIVNGGQDNDSYLVKFFGSLLPNSISYQRYKTTDERTTLKADETIVTIIDSSGIDTLDFSEYGTGINLDMSLVNGAQIIDTAGTNLILAGTFEILIGTEFDDEITVSPLPDISRFAVGGSGTDILNYITSNTEANDDGSTITTTGFAEVMYMNFETVNLLLDQVLPSSNAYLIKSSGFVNNYPNPFTSFTTILYSLDREAEVNLSIYNIAGQMVTTLVNEKQPAGVYKIQWHALNENGQKLNTGVYFCALEANGHMYSMKIIKQ